MKVGLGDCEDILGRYRGSIRRRFGLGSVATSLRIVHTFMLGSPNLRAHERTRYVLETLKA